VSDEKWGNWFQRAVRLPTRHLAVRLVFPSQLKPMVWGIETTMTAEAVPFRTAIERHQEGKNEVFAWSTEEPPLHARYRLEWRFGQPADPPAEPASPSETMRALGIVQEREPILRLIARPFDLPAEAEDARRVIAELSSAIERVEAAHVFSKGMGIAAPQIGISRAAALVRTPAGETITLLNPRVIEETPGDEQYEGCLSFFDVRGMVPRPLVLQVEHQDVDASGGSPSSSGAQPASSLTRSTTSTGCCTPTACGPVSTRSRSASTDRPAKAGATDPLCRLRLYVVKSAAGILGVRAQRECSTVSRCLG
jgi:peptide deformylase